MREADAASARHTGADRARAVLGEIAAACDCLGDAEHVLERCRGEWGWRPATSYGRRWRRRIRPSKAERPVRRAWRVRKARLITGFGGVRWRDRAGAEKPRDGR